MKQLISICMLMAIALLLIALGGSAWAHGHHEVVDKKAILLVTFGTSIPKAQTVFTGVDKAFRKAFPGVEVRWAYTSKTVRKIVAKKQGKTWLSPQEALAKLMADGFTQVVVQSLHVIPGSEFHDLVRTVKGFRSMNHHFKPLISYPLCSTNEDLQKVAKILAANLPSGRKPGQAVLFMGHGTHHPAGVVYPALGYMLGQKDPLLLMGTVEGYPTLDDLKAQLLKRGVKKAWLLPFMTVAGDHAVNDMAGDEPDSWKSVLTKAGIKAVPVMKALSEMPGVVALYVEHARKCYAHFK